MQSTTAGYGTIPTTTAASYPNYSNTRWPPTGILDSSMYHRIRSRTEAFFTTRRPWREFFEPSSMSRPDSYSEAVSRIRQNFNYFLVNYTIVILVILFLSLIYHPISMIVFLIVFVAWFFLYFFRDAPVVLFNRAFDERTVALGLGLVTIVALVFSDVGVNVFVSLTVGFLVVGLHAAFRASDDLFLEEQEGEMKVGWCLLLALSSCEVHALPIESDFIMPIRQTLGTWTNRGNKKFC